MLRISVFALTIGFAICALIADLPHSARAGSVSPASAPTPETRCKACIRPGSNAENKPPDVVALDLDKTEIQLPCAESTPGPRAGSVGVKLTAADPEGDVLTYNYTVSGGRIVGTGANVFWDLSKVQPGTYVIIAGVDDGCGVCGRTEKKSVTVVACAAAGLEPGPAR